MVWINLIYAFEDIVNVPPLNHVLEQWWRRIDMLRNKVDDEGLLKMFLIKIIFRWKVRLIYHNDKINVWCIAYLLNRTQDKKAGNLCM